MQNYFQMGPVGFDKFLQSFNCVLVFELLEPYTMQLYIRSVM